MAIITTPKGWAIEIETTASALSKPTASDMAEHYTAILKNLLQTIEIVNSHPEQMGIDFYYTLDLLGNMLPSYDNAIAMFENMPT